STASSSIEQVLANHKPPNGETAIGDGITEASNELMTNGRAAASQIILVFTDGDNNTGSEPAQAAAKAKNEGQIVHLVGLYPPGLSALVNVGNVLSIAQAGSGELFQATNATELLALFRNAKMVNIDRVEVTNTTMGAASVQAQLVTGNYNAPVDLVVGQNVLEVLATDTDGGTAKASVTVTVPSIPPEPCVVNPSGPQCPGSQGNPNPQFRPVKLRPQVLMAGFDPMLLDVIDDSLKITAVVREGISPIRHVYLNENTGSLNMGMKLEGQLFNGDKVYSLTIGGVRGQFYKQELSNLFGSGVGEFNITVVDKAPESHSFPKFETGNNVDLEDADLEVSRPSTSVAPYTTKGIRRSKPQAIMVGFDPIMIDYDDDAFKVKAIVRAGLVAIKHVRLKTSSGALLANMEKEQELANGDVMYSMVFPFTRGSLHEAGVLRDLFGTENPQSEFIVEVIDKAEQRHTFPTLQGCDCPEQ
ncbi:VWA domain-containing protein, partial [Candidatus Marithioploca araucensis]|nr:VWA domain-containing protein [Candidatus Marithioploca araucensis]